MRAQIPRPASRSSVSPGASALSSASQHPGEKPTCSAPSLERMGNFYTRGSRPSYVGWWKEGSPYFGNGECHFTPIKTRTSSITSWLIVWPLRISCNAARISGKGVVKRIAVVRRSTENGASGVPMTSSIAAR